MPAGEMAPPRGIGLVAVAQQILAELVEGDSGAAAQQILAELVEGVHTGGG